MKMTRLEWRYLQKIALDHPYFDTHKLPLTEKEAKAIVKANVKMTGREFVDSVYTKLGMTRPDEKKDRFAGLRSVGELFTVPPIRKIAIAILVVIMMIVFFAATPAGRAIAESVIQYIVYLFDDKSLSVTQSDLGLTVVSMENDDRTDTGERQNNSTDFVFAESFKDFTEATGKTPIVLPLPCTELCYEYDKAVDYIVLYSTYQTSGGQIVTYQIWDVEDMVTTSLSGYEAYDADETVYYSTEEETGYIYCKKITKESVFALSSKGNYSLDDLIKMLES